MPEKPLQTLHRSLLQNNFDVPSDYASFERTLTAKGQEGYQNRYTLWKSLKENNYDVPDKYESFSRTLFVPVQKTTATQSQPAVKKSSGAPLTQQQKMGYSMGAQSILNNANTIVQGFEQGVKNRAEYRKQKPLGGGVAKTTKTNLETGKPEERYITSTGASTDNQYVAEAAQRAINQEYHQPTVDEQLTQAYAERDRLNDEMSKNRVEWVDQDGRVHYGNRGGDEAMQSLETAYRQNEERIKTLTYEKEDAGFWNRLGTELGDISSWNPYNSASDAMSLLRTKMKIDRGETLNTSDNLLLANTLLNKEAHDKYDANRGAMFRAGGIAAESIRLLPDFAVGMGPMKGIATGVAKGTSKLAAKTLGKEVTERLAGKLLTKSLGIGAGALAAGASMANTVQAPRLASETMKNMTGDLTLDKDGNYQFEGGDNFLNSVLKAEQSLIPEAASEVTGEFLPGVGSFLKKVGLKKIANGLSRLEGTKWYKGYSNALEKVGFHGAPGEMVEEYLGDVYSLALGDPSGIVGDKNGKGGWGDLDKHIDIVLGTATLSSLLHAPNIIHTGYSAEEYLRYGHKTKVADKEGRSAFGSEGWDSIKKAIDGTTNETISDVVTDIFKSNDMTTERKKAVLDYAVNLQRQRGHLLAIMADGKDSDASPEEKQAAEILDNSYTVGYEADTPEEKQNIGQNLESATQNLDALGEGFANWVKYESNPPMAVLSYMMSHRDTYSDEQIAVAADYYQSKSAANGMNQATADNAELEGEQSVKPLYTTMEQGDGQFTVSSFDKDGNLLRQESFTTQDEANAYRSEVRMQKEHLDLQDYYTKASSDPSLAGQIAAFEEGQEWEPGTVEQLVNGDPMQMSETELQMSDVVRGFLSSLTYPPTEVHTEHSIQEGVEAAENSGIETDTPNEEIVSSVVVPFIEAKENFERLFDKNENLAEEVQYYEQMGKSKQEIISMLDSFSPGEVQSVIDYFNAEARFDGFMDRTRAKIDERAKNERSRRTFTGTINGQEDKENVVSISDGTNTYTLVSGNVSTDADGRITDSDTGLIIALDENGDFVQLSDTSGYSVLPIEQTLDDYQSQLEENLQLQITDVIDPEGKIIPEEAGESAEAVDGEEIQSGDNADVEASAQDTGANEASATVPVQAATEPPAPPSVHVEDVTDKEGIKRYEDGIDIDDAIADIQNDGLDVNEVADASIAEANEIIDKINNKPTKTRKDLLDRKKAQDIASYYTSLKERYAAIQSPAEEAPAGEPADTVAETEPAGEAPEWRYDTPQEARNRGYKVIEGHRVDRQEEKDMPQGMEVEVQYSTKDKVKGHLTVSELDEVQGSHLTNGQRNDKHFLTEAQPKAEFGADRQAAAQANASEENFRPELMLTFNGTQSAYSGSASQTNRRGEVIQGNGRRNLAEYIYAPGNEAVAKKYKDFLKAHAEELGTTADAIEQMEKPFAHIVLDVNDDEAIRLGQFTAQDLESGGKKVPEVSTVTTKLGSKYGTFANIVLKHEDADASLSERIEGNMEAAVKWLNNAGIINNTEAKTLLEDKALARQFVKDVITDQLFKESHPDLRTMFYELPKNIQSAIISVVGREVAINSDKSILKDIQESIMAYHELMSSSPEFANAQGANYEKRYASASAAVKDWLRQINMDGTVNSEKFSNFDLGLAKMYKSLKDQRTLAGYLRDYYDKATGATRELGMFEDNSQEPKTKEELIKQIFGIDYGRQRTVPLADNHRGREEGEEGSTGSTEGGEPEPEGRGQADNRGRDTVDAEVRPSEQLKPIDLRDAIKPNSATLGSDIAKQKAQLRAKLKSWLSDENIDWAEGKDLNDVIGRFGNEPEPIAVLPTIVRQNVPTLTDDYLYCGKAYFIDHHANHHPELEIDEYDNIQSILDGYDDIKDLSEGGRLKIAFVKKLDKGYAVVVELSKENDKIMLHKTFFYKDSAGKRIPFKNKPSLKEKWSVDGSTTISPVEEQQPAGTENISALDQSSDGKDSNISETKQENQKKSLPREDYLTSHPLTEEQIMADTEATEDEKLNAIDFLKGEDDSAISRFYYDSIYQRAATESPQAVEEQVNPMAAIEAAAKSFREEQKAKDQQDIDDALKEFNDFLDNAKGSNVLDAFMRKGLEGNDKAQANLLDAFTLANEAQRMFLKDLLRLASKVGYAYLKKGVHDAQAWSKQMTGSIGQKLKDVLGWDDAIISEFVDEVWNQKYTVDGQRMRMSEHAERLKKNKGADTAVNVNKKENNVRENVVSSQQETSGKPADTVANLEGDSAEFAERQAKIDTLREKVRSKLKSLVMWNDKAQPMSFYKKLAEEVGLSDLSNTDLQEIIEAEVVSYARELSNKSGWTDKQKYDHIVRLYNAQPSLNARDNDRINLQQYSTAAPMAFLMGRFVKNGLDGVRGLEPSAGNGMLTINLPKEGMHVNDIDEMRLSNLQKQGFGEVTSQDGLQSFGEKQYDVIVTNPPFGNVTPKVYDGLYEISGLEHQMAINALESMKDDGRAAIIIGGNTEYNTNGTIKGKDRVFLNYLYSHYNVVDVINMDGKTLYSRQGTGVPLRMILIDGRKAFDKNSFAPVQSKARAEQVKSYDELFNRVSDDILRNKEHNGDTPNGVHTAEGGQNGGLSDNGNVSPSNETGVRGVRGGSRSGEHQLPTEPVIGVQRGDESTEAGEGQGRSKPETDGGVGTRPVLRDRRGDQPEQSGGSQAVPSGNRGREVVVGGSDTQRLSGGSVDSRAGLSVEQPAHKRELGEEKVPYRKQSGNPFDLQSQMPAEQADVVKKALEDLDDVDQFLVDELGYSSKEELYNALAAEQIDSVALAISQMKKGDAFIIGDQTGIGKGRQGAALIRWAVKNGKAPVYFTAKPELFSSVYRDIKDIHSDGLRPFILASDKIKARITERNKDGNDEVLFDLPSDKEQKRVLDYINKNGELPPEYDFMITTYSQVGNGTMEYENGTKKARSYGKGKKATNADINGQSKRNAIESLAGNSIVIMDESHLAGGASARGNYLQYISTKANGITYISATFAKRPDNMPLYSLRTAISKAGVAIGELIDAVKRGGATFQEIMSKALTEAGQMIRRERDMRGVSVDWRGIEDEAVIQNHYKQYDKIIGLFNDIINFQRTYVDPIVDNLNDKEADVQGSVDHTPGTRDMGISNTPFASQTHNIVKQVLLSLKAEEGAKFAVECLKNGEKPVICVENTNEAAAERAVGNSEEDMAMPDLSTNLQKGLDGTLRIQKTDAFGNKIQSTIPISNLSEEGQRRYHEIKEAIENASTGLSLSPIDVIKNHIKQAGYTVAELTGRNKEFVYNQDGSVKRVNRTDTDNKKNAADFNSGKIDAVIINKSAGTGIDLHAGIKFDNTDQRHMITVQAQSDINDEVQMRGRTDRTGQKQHSKYTYIVSTIPSEQRLLMMLKAKLRSLDANTTSSQKSKFNEMQVQDIINKYGDDIVIQYLAEHPDIAVKLVDPLKWTQKFGEGFDTMPSETLASGIGIERGESGSIASKVLGRMALLKVKEQEKMLKEIGDLYQAEIDRLDEMGENDLEITEMPLKAKTLRKVVWEAGIEPGGKNPFADNTYVEEVQMDVLKKPMKGEEVKAAQERLLSSAATKTPEQGLSQPVKNWEDFKKATMAKVDEWAEQKKKETTDTITARAEKKASAEQEKYVKGAKKSQSKTNMTDEEIERNGKYQYDHFYEEEMKKLDNALAGIEAQRQVFEVALDTFSTDGVYALPMNIYDLGGMTFEPGFGKLIDVKISSNFSPNASTLTFATLDGRRKITVPISGRVKQQNNEKRELFPVINTLTAQTRHGMFGSNVANTLKVLEQNIDNWDRLTSSAARKNGYIITGNLLKALVSTREQGAGGKLISYTTDTGEVRQGILMPDTFNPSKLTSKTPISSMKEELRRAKDSVVSADGDVTVRVGNWDWLTNGFNTLELIVPKSKKKGEKYFNDKTLLRLMDGQFEGSSKLKAEFKRDNLDAVMKRLDELGVTVNEEKKDDSDTGRRYHVTDDPMEAILSAAELWNQEKNGRYNIQSDTSSNKTKENGQGKDLHQQGKSRQVKRGRKGGLEETEGSRLLSARTRRIIDAVARELGIRINVANRPLPKNTDAFWGDDGRTVELSIDLAKKGDDALMRVLGHELTHHIKELSKEYPQVWDAYVAMVREYMGSDEFARRVDKRRKDYDAVYEREGWEKLTDEEIVEEVCADFAGDKIFTDESFVKALVDRVEREGGDVRSFIEKMLDFIKGLYDRLKAFFDLNDSESQKAQVTLDMAKTIWGDMYQYASEKELAGHYQAKLHVVENKDLIDKLEQEPKITVYRAMQLRDGKLYPPMSAKVNGKWQDPLPLGQWSQADEHPELVNKDGKFDLDKGNGKKVAGVVYAPYMHGSTTMLNDQFKEAQDRPELVVVEAEMPESELTSGYQAEKSPRKTGMLDWKAGTIQGQLTGTRQVMLSRWVKPVRIVPSSEVAASIKDMIEGQVDVMPTNVVTPEQRSELEKLGVKFVKTDNKEIIQEGDHKGEQYSDVYGKKSKQAKKKPRRRFHVSEDPMEAINHAAEGYRNAQEGRRELSDSIKRVYEETMDTKSYVVTEAFQDSMLALKVFQNSALKKDEQILDSQNAYMAENLMHGKSKNEMDLFNEEHRKGLEEITNKILNTMGWSMRDFNMYLLTKSGLERNREFYVRDWLKKERKKTIREYKDLSDAAKNIFDSKSAAIEQQFEDGDITEEEKEQNLLKALQESHNEWLDDIENGWESRKRRWANIGKTTPSGLFTFASYLEGLDHFIRGEINDDYVASEHDYSGLTEMYGDEEGKYDEDAIIADLMDDESAINNNSDANAPDTEVLWNRIRAANRYALERYREAGMRTDEQINKIEQMFHWYVPMRGFDAKMGEDVYQYFTSNAKANSYVGGLIKNARGRKSMANSPLATMFAMAYKAISDCNENRMKQHFYRFCQAHPNDLVVMDDAWVKQNEVTGEWEEVWPDIPEDATDEQVREAVKAFDEEMRQLSSEGKAKKMKGKVRFDYKPIDKKHKSEHTVEVMINGQKKLMTIVGNPRLAQALNGHTKWENGKNILSKVNAHIKNMMSSVFTSYSPTFAMRNMLRDWTHFAMMLNTREGAGYAKAALNYYRETLPRPYHGKKRHGEDKGMKKIGMVELFKKYRAGTLDISKEVERDFKDWMDAGGVTGYVHMKNIDKMEREIKKLVGDRSGTNKALDKAEYWLIDNLHLQGAIDFTNKVWDSILGLIEAYNEAVENNARFATFRASRHYAGRTKARSAHDAKEITVNFDKKGSGHKIAGFKTEQEDVNLAAQTAGVTSQVIGEGRLFFNATIQAIANTFKSFKNPDGTLNTKYIARWASRYAMPPFALGLLLPYVNQILAAMLGGDDDDPYANLPEWTRRKNLCIYIGNDNFITIPVGQELSAFLSLGDIAAANLYAPELKPVDKDWMDEVEGVMSTFSPIDLDTKITSGGFKENPLSETAGRISSVLAPVIAVEQNLSWMGRPIYREDLYKYDEFKPEYQMVYQSANPVVVGAFKLLHELSGGDEDARGRVEINPAIVQYLWEQYTGGPGKVFSNTISMGNDVKDLFKGEGMPDFNIRKIEGLKAFVQQGDDRTEYYRADAKYRKYQKDADATSYLVKRYEKRSKEDPSAKMKLDSLKKGKDYTRMEMIKASNKHLKKMREDAYHATGAERRRLMKTYNENMKALVDKLDEVQ